MPDSAGRRCQGVSQLGRPLAISLEQVKSDSLRGLSANTRHTAKRIDQACQ
jgi:hypothetical protein